MSSVDTRNVARESLFLFAEVALEGIGATMRVKVRNLSSGGMMAEAGRPVTSGERLVVTLRNVGEVPGTVAWVEGNRFGIAFEREIDPASVRAHTSPDEAEAASAQETVPAPRPLSPDRYQFRRI